MEVLPLLSSSQAYAGIPFPSQVSTPLKVTVKHSIVVKIQAKKEDEAEKQSKPRKNEQSLFSSVTEALDFSQVRSAEDADLLDEARQSTKAGERMNKAQYGALRRKIGGTYKDFFKSYVEVEGKYVEEGWVDKTCKVCGKDTKGEPRQVDKFGRYIHVACADKSNSGNFFTKLFQDDAQFSGFDNYIYCSNFFF